MNANEREDLGALTKDFVGEAYEVANAICAYLRSFAAKFCLISIIAVTVLLLQGTFAAVATGSDAIGGGQSWPVFRGNAHATGVAESTMPDQPQLLWKYSLEKGSFVSTPVIADGVVFIGDLDGTVHAIDLQTGQKKWKFKDPTPQVGFNTTAAVKDGLVYLGDEDGVFFCLDATSGEKKWSYKTDGEINSAANFYHDYVLFGSQDATLYCLDRNSGKEIWKHTIGDQIRCSPTVAEDRCFLAGCDGKLHVVNLENGEETGAVDIQAPTGSTPAAAGRLIYFGTEGATFFCIDWKQLTPIWNWKDRVHSYPIRSSAALTSAAVIFGGRDKMVHAMDPKSGDKLWNFSTKGRIDGSPVVAGQRVFVGSADGRIYGLDLKSGEKVWDYEAGGSFVGSPAVAAARLVIASNAGVIYCFGEKPN